MLGECKWFRRDKGYGFVTSEDPEIDYFVHQSNIQMDGYRMLTTGQRVEYTVNTGPTGKPQASCVICASNECTGKKFTTLPAE